MEGFLLFAVPEIVSLCHKRIFLIANKRVAYARRMATKTVEETYFHQVRNSNNTQILWPGYLRYNRVVVDLAMRNEVILFDAEQPPDGLFEDSLRCIHKT